MKTCFPCCAAKGFISLFVLLICTSGLQAATNKKPVLISQSTNTRAVALESVTFRAEPFFPTMAVPFSTDTRTRICIFAMDLELLPGEGANAFSSDVQDATGKIYPLRVEHVGQVPNFPGITMIIVRLHDDLVDNGDVLLRINLHGCPVIECVWRLVIPAVDRRTIPAPSQRQPLQLRQAPIRHWSRIRSRDQQQTPIQFVFWSRRVGDRRHPKLRV